jgi:hypothetical protein
MPMRMLAVAMMDMLVIHGALLHAIVDDLCGRPRQGNDPAYERPAEQEIDNQDGLGIVMAAPVSIGSRQEVHEDQK